MADNIKDHFVNFEGNRIFCRLINQKHLKENGSLLLFLHEGLGCTALWKDFPELLGNELQLPCLLYDRPGYGKSDGLKGKHNADFKTDVWPGKSKTARYHTGICLNDSA